MTKVATSRERVIMLIWVLIGSFSIKIPFQWSTMVKFDNHSTSRSVGFLKSSDQVLQCFIFRKLIQFGVTEEARNKKQFGIWYNFNNIISALVKFSFLISQPKHMLWVLKRTVSMRRFF